MAKPPAFQWYPKDCDTDELVRLMDDREFGFYMRCLNHAWLNLGLPGTLEEIARVIGRPKPYVEKVWVRVGQRFELKEGRYINPKQEEQRKNAREFVDSRKDAANARWSKCKTDARASNMHELCNALQKETADAGAVKPKNKDPSEEPYNSIEGWPKFWLAYPSHRINQFMDLRLWMGVVESAEMAAHICAKLEQFKCSETWQNPKFVPKASRFLGERIFDTEPDPPPVPPNESNGLTHWERT